MHPQLSYGVMVAQQVLVLFVVVRIRLGQLLQKVHTQFFTACGLFSLMLSSYYSIALIYINFVKIILLKTDNCALMLRKRLFCVAKPTLLPCKTAAFGMQNNRFCNILMYSELHYYYAFEKCLHLCCLLFVH